MLIGYARVSTTDQNLNLQKDALEKAGCERLFTETASGAKAERVGLLGALKECRSGDTLVVWKLDRLGRSLSHLVETVRDLIARGVGFKSLQESIDTTTSGGKLIFHIFASLAEFERDIIRERTNAGLSAARARGRKGGRPKGVDEKKRQAALTLKKDPKRSVKEICEILNISRNTYYKYTTSKEDSSLEKQDDNGPRVETPLDKPKEMKVKMSLYIENNSKFVRGKGKAREEIEMFILRRYKMEKSKDSRWEYLLSIPYTTDEELDNIINDLLQEAQNMADLRNCFTEGSVMSIDDPDRSW
jgi:DNA invertase Pin-like site-specific DNA recombinase